MILCHWLGGNLVLFLGFLLPPKLITLLSIKDHTRKYRLVRSRRTSRPCRMLHSGSRPHGTWCMDVQVVCVLWRAEEQQQSKPS